MIHVCGLTIGLGMSIGSLPYIKPQFGVCGILPPLTSARWQVSLFYTAPVSIVLVVLSTTMVSICWTVYIQRMKSSKWVADKKKQLSITRKVFWQSFWYMMAFYVTLPFVLLSFYLEYTSEKHFWIFAGTAILAPLQGLMNALVYFQRTKGAQVFRDKMSALLFGCSKAQRNSGKGRGRSSVPLRVEEPIDSHVSSTRNFMPGDEKGGSTDRMLLFPGLHHQSQQSSGDFNGDDYHDPLSPPQPEQHRQREMPQLQNPTNEMSSDGGAPSHNSQIMTTTTTTTTTNVLTRQDVLDTFVPKHRELAFKRKDIIDERSITAVLEYWELHERNIDNDSVEREERLDDTMAHDHFVDESKMDGQLQL